VFEQVDFAYAAEADSRHLDLRVMHTERTAISDPVMLGRILQNLVANAVRHTPSGKILVGCRPRGQDLAIEVWDTGTGIAAESLQDIFREFVKLKSGAPSPGLGLGLYIVKGLADQLGHRLEVCSRVGKGSVFRLLVPMSERPQTATGQAPSRDALSFAGRRVLIVDDDPTVLAAMRTVLESWGCEVAGAGNAREALEVALGGSGIDLVLCDHELPGGMTGLDVLERVRAGSHQAPPALLVTGNTSASLQRSAEAAGYRVLHKPVEAGVLREAIAAILGGNGASARPG
jgi:CheY-like chemotaxis protein